MNQYPAWKYVLILVILVLGTLYALPNMFGEDPAVQVTSARGFGLSDNLTTTIDDALVVEGISYKSNEQIANRLLYRFNSTSANSTSLRSTWRTQLHPGCVPSAASP